jgi:hypothetical protein
MFQDKDDNDDDDDDGPSSTTTGSSLSALSISFLNLLAPEFYV